MGENNTEHNQVRASYLYFLENQGSLVFDIEEIRREGALHPYLNWT